MGYLAQTRIWVFNNYCSFLLLALCHHFSGWDYFIVAHRWTCGIRSIFYFFYFLKKQLTHEELTVEL